MLLYFKTKRKEKEWVVTGINVAIAIKKKLKKIIWDIEKLDWSMG